MREREEKKADLLKLTNYKRTSRRSKAWQDPRRWKSACWVQQGAAGGESKKKRVVWGELVSEVVRVRL